MSTDEQGPVHEHAKECVLLYGDGPDAPTQCDCRFCCPICLDLDTRKAL